MSKLEAREEYRSALRQGQKEYRDLMMRGKAPNPAVLDEILPRFPTESVQDIPLVDIPADRIVGTKSAGRISAFTAGFLPILPEDTEFAAKWVGLCAAHLSDEGIRDPIMCYEYLGNFYVQEGNKRVSVLKYFGAPKIPGSVCRILPPPSDDPVIKSYYEFLDFYESARLYDVQFRRPGDYAKLLGFLGKEPGEDWDDRERKTFRAYFHYFKDAFNACGGELLDLRPEEALLLWLQVYPFQDLGKLSGGELRKILASMWDDVVAMAHQTPVEVRTDPSQRVKGSILTRLITPTPDHIRVAFIHRLDATSSAWTKAHDEGRQHLENVFGDKVTVRSYDHADSTQQTEGLLNQAVEEGAQVVFTTSPQLSRATLKAAVKHQKVRFLNCSMNLPYPSIRSYYSRIHEGKFITGAIAGAMAKNDRIGYVSAYPIYGEPASINAFALGAQMTNPRAKIELRWSCQPGSPVQDFVADGIRVISNRNVPTSDEMYMEFGEYGTYLLGENGTMTTLGSPVWLWGRFYENVIRSIMSGAWDQDIIPQQPVNYWWGMNSGVIDVKLHERLPAGLLVMADILRKGLREGTIDPFLRKIVAQDGSVKNDGTHSFSPDELLHMDWLCDNVVGSIPEFEDVLPIAQPLVRELGLHRESIPIEKEGTL